MKLQLTRYQMEQTALALGARLKTLRQWRQKGWPANWLLKLEENFGEPFDIVELWTEQDHKRWLEGLDRARSQNVADVYQAENERLKAENVELRRRLSNQQVTILNLQQELGEDAVRKIAVDKALALTRQAAVERAQFFVQQLQRDLQRCDMAQAQMAKLLHIRPTLTPCGEKLVSSDHFSVDGTLIEAWASMKSFKPKDAASPDDTPPPDSGRNPEVDLRQDALGPCVNGSS